jgi:hypothetical protein
METPSTGWSASPYHAETPGGKSDDEDAPGDRTGRFTKEERRVLVQVVTGDAAMLSGYCHLHRWRPVKRSTSAKDQPRSVMFTIAERFNEVARKPRQLDALRHHLKFRRGERSANGVTHGKTLEKLIEHRRTCSAQESCTRCLQLHRMRVQRGLARCAEDEGGCAVCAAAAPGGASLPFVLDSIDCRALLKEVKALNALLPPPAPGAVKVKVESGNGSGGSSPTATRYAVPSPMASSYASSDATSIASSHPETPSSVYSAASGASGFAAAAVAIAAESAASAASRKSTPAARVNAKRATPLRIATIQPRTPPLAPQPEAMGLGLGEALSGRLAMLGGSSASAADSEAMQKILLEALDLPTLQHLIAHKQHEQRLQLQLQQQNQQNITISSLLSHMSSSSGGSAMDDTFAPSRAGSQHQQYQHYQQQQQQGGMLSSLIDDSFSDDGTAPLSPALTQLFSPTLCFSPNLSPMWGGSGKADDGGGRSHFFGGDVSPSRTKYVAPLSPSLGGLRDQDSNSGLFFSNLPPQARWAAQPTAFQLGPPVDDAFAQLGGGKRQRIA